MCIALIGGMERLERHYKKEAKRCGVELKVFNIHKVGIHSKIRNVDVVVIFTNKVSHNAKKEVMNAARANNIPVHMYHSCGVCTFRDFLNCSINAGRDKYVSRLHSKSN
ncbi:MAG: DUF2325 domain-containing protein [bacterium]